MPPSDAHDRQPKPKVMPRGRHVGRKGYSTPKPQVVTGRTSRPRTVGTGDPVIGFLTHAAKVVGGQVASDAKDWYTGAKKVYGAVDRYSAQRLQDMNPLASRRQGKRNVRLYRKGVPLSDARYRTSSLELSPSGVGRVVQLGNAFLKAKHPRAMSYFSQEIQDMIEGLPVAHSGGGGRLSNVYRLPLKKVSIEDTQDVGIPYRIPFVIGRKSGRAYVGEQGGVHGLMERELALRGVEDDWMQGWIIQQPKDPRGGLGDMSDMIRIDLGYGHETGSVVPPNTTGINQLVRYITRNYEDADLAGRAARPIPRMIEERQGSRANTLLNRLGGPMTPEEIMDFMKQEARRKKGK